MPGVTGLGEAIPMLEESRIEFVKTTGSRTLKSVNSELSG